MRRFSALFEALDSTNSTLRKVDAMKDYFGSAPPGDAAWAVFLLSGRRLKRLVAPSRLREWLVEATGMPRWLVEESYAAVGDLAETISLLVPGAATAMDSTSLSLAEWMERRILPLGGLTAEAQGERVKRWWAELDAERRFLVNKLLTGSLRVGVSRTLVARALAETSDLPRPVILHRLMGKWKPSAAWYEALLSAETSVEDASRPYPFCLASPLPGGPEELGSRAQWQAEWKWDGIRAQLVRRAGQCFLWSRGEDLVTDRFPEVARAAEWLPDGTVLDGELLAWNEHGVMPFSELQRRLGRKRIPAPLLEEVPIRFMAYDLLEDGGLDVRLQTLWERRSLLCSRLAAAPAHLTISPVLEGPDWATVAERRCAARANGVEGLMLKRLDSGYRTGRRRGDWWKWKVDPYTVDAVMIYAQPGHGRRASLYTDYTFAVWRDDDLVPIAKAYSGLSNSEIRRLDRWIRSNTVERFGPVRSVRPEQVFELAFEGINPSSRHKSGVALRFPRIHRWRHDLAAGNADRLRDLKSLLTDAAG